MDTRPNNLPVQLTSFIGREHEIVEIRHLLSSTRLLTLTGSGGTGKTRLALQVAAEVLSSFTDGVWFIELTPLSDPALVPATVASVLGVREEPGRPLLSTLLDWLRPKQMLLILDNCEHLIDACANMADSILRAGRETRILASSREALGIDGESAWRVPSLPTPHPKESLNLEQLEHYAAVRLFIERATQALATFRVTNANAPAVTQICYRLDGIPLAIELAAARVKALRTEQIASRLDDRFHLLTGGSRTALRRQQTLRGMIDWSHGLLSEPEQVLLRRLSVFVGGWTLEAAEAVCAGDGIEPRDVMDLLARLIDKSLIVLDEQAAEPRYRMLETLRQYAHEKLLDAGEEKQIRSGHLLFFAKWVEEAEPKLRGIEQTTWLERLELEYDNLRAAMDWSLQYDEAVEAGLRLAGSLWWFWWNRAHASEGQERLVRILSRAGATGLTVARAKALNAAAAMQWSQGRYAEAHPLLQEALSIGRELTDPQYLASSLQFLGVVAFDQGDYVTARSSLEEALAIRKGMGDRWGAGFLLNNLGDVAFLQDDYARAQTLGEEALSLLRELNENSVIPYTFRQLGRLALYGGDYATAVSLCKESLRINSAARDVRGIAACVAALAGVAAAQGQGTRAVHLLAAADAAVVAITSPFLPADRKACDRTIALLNAQLDEATFARAWADGRALTLEQAVTEAGQVSATSQDDAERALGTKSSLPAYPAGLSGREVDVLRLVASGLTNADIAERLVISPRTVNAHLRSIYGKLDVTTRTAAARFATENKLV